MKDYQLPHDIPWVAVYAAYGKAILSAHHLEKQLAFFVASWDCLKNRSDETTFSSTLNALQKKTLGELIKIGVSSGAISEELHRTLDSARELRNFLIHYITDSLALRLATQLGPDEVVEELWSIGCLFMDSARELTEMAEFCCEVHGFPMGRAYELAVNTIKRASELETLLPDKCF
jgi:hypothetical protein